MTKRGVHHGNVVIHVFQDVFRRVNVDVTAHPYPIVGIGEARPQYEILQRRTGVIDNSLPGLRLVFVSLGVEHPAGIPFVVLLPVKLSCRLHLKVVDMTREIQSEIAPDICFPLFLVRLVDNSQCRGQHPFSLLVPGDCRQPHIGGEAEIAFLHRRPLRVVGIPAFLSEGVVRQYLVHVGVVVIRMLVVQPGLETRFLPARFHLRADGTGAV